MVIAVDFDGTIVEHKYPAIGKEIPFATSTLKQLQKDGHQLILWSVREGELLQEAVDWCEAKGVRFHAVNQYLDEDDGGRECNANYARKLKVDCFIDDRNIGGLPDWGTIYQLISNNISYEDYIIQQSSDTSYQEKKKKTWWQF